MVGALKGNNLTTRATARKTDSRTHITIVLITHRSDPKATQERPQTENSASVNHW